MALLFSRNQVLSKNLKNLTSFIYPTPSASTKGCVRFFSFCLDLELLAKIKKDLISTLFFYIFINKSRSKQNKKNPTNSFVDITK